MSQLLDKEIFEWIREVGAESISVEGRGKRSREMAEMIFRVHRLLYVMRKGGMADRHETAQQLLLVLRRIQFACAVSHVSDPTVFNKIQKICNHYEHTYTSRPLLDSGLAQLRQVDRQADT